MIAMTDADRRTVVKRYGLVVLLGVTVLALDQGSKYWVLNLFDLPARGSVAVLPFLNLTMVWNPGVSFGLFKQYDQWGRLAIDAMDVGVVAGLLIWLPRHADWWMTLAAGLILGGAAGNLIDRVVFGAVVDFLHFHALGHDWYVFNIADAAIVIGGFAIAGDTLFAGAKNARRNP
jgi:lipoprotein signal peptidase